MNIAYILISTPNDTFYEQTAISVMTLRKVMPDANVYILVDKDTKSTFKDKRTILEKYNVAEMGYYKDIIIEEVVGSRITAENAEIDLKQGKIVTEEEEYLLSHFDIILLMLKEDTEGNLFIYKGYGIEPKDIKLQKNDRIAINEIEDTIIIYRGY